MVAEQRDIVKNEIDLIYTREGGSGSTPSPPRTRPSYFVTVPSNKLELWFWMESDRLANPVFREFYSERTWFGRSAAANRVDAHRPVRGGVQGPLLGVAPVLHGRDGLAEPTWSPSTARQAETYFATYYAPNNLTAAIVGDFDPKADARAREGVLRRGSPPGRRQPPEMITDETPQLAEKRFLAEADTNPEVEVRFHAVPFNNSEMFAFQLIADLLNSARGGSTRRSSRAGRPRQASPPAFTGR